MKVTRLVDATNWTETKGGTSQVKTLSRVFWVHSRLAMIAARYSVLTLCAALAGSATASNASAAAQDTTGVGTLSGSVADASGTPIAFATICVATTMQCVIADGRGSFRLENLRPGEYALEVTPAGETPVPVGRFDVRAGVDQRLEITLPGRDRFETTVTVTAPSTAAPPEVKTSVHLISSREIFRAAGALQDVTRYVQTVPGVVIGSDDFRNDIIVRGGSPLENLFIIDNVEIPNINTFANFASAGGTASILDPSMIRDVSFMTGGYPASYTNRTSSVLQITQREGSRDELHGRATLGFAGAGGLIEGPLAKGRGSWAVSARRSVLDLITDDIGVGGVPVLYTVNAKAVYDLSQTDRIWAVNVTGVDRIRLGLTDSTPNDEEIFNFDIRYRGWRSGSGVNWQHLFGSRGVGLAGITNSVAKREADRQGSREERRPAAGNAGRGDHRDQPGGLQHAIRSRDASSAQIVERCLERIETLNPRLNAFATVLTDQALDQAKQADQEIQRGGWRGLHHGVPVGIKDFYDTAGIATTAAFEPFKNRVPRVDAVGVQRLKHAGAVIVGKMNMHTFGMGTTGLESMFGPVKN